MEGIVFNVRILAYIYIYIKILADTILKSLHDTINSTMYFGITINVISSFYITSDRNEVTVADNPTNNDTYEDIEGTTSNQRKKDRK
jgi:hypothetical protein